MARYLTLFIVLFALGSCGLQPPEVVEHSEETSTISLELSVRDDGTASPLWTSGTAIAIGDTAAGELARENLPLTPEAEAWLKVLRQAVPSIEERAGELARILDVPQLNAIVVAGNRGSSDGFGWTPNYIGINVQAFVDTYGPPDNGAEDRMVRIAAHEHLHLLTYAFYPNHLELRTTPVDRALWTMFFEGIGDYVSVSRRWLPDQYGVVSPVAEDTLRVLEPIFIERLEKLVTADAEEEKELRSGIAMGKFDRKWGSLPVALWLHSEAKRCGEVATLRTMLRLERDGVLFLALRHAAPELRPRIRALQETLARGPKSANDANPRCLASFEPIRAS